MVKPLIVDYCLRQAQEYLELATAASDPDLRNQYLKLAQSLTELASDLDADPGKVDKSGNRPRAPAGPPKFTLLRNRTK